MVTYDLTQLKQSLIEEGCNWIYNTQKKYSSNARNLTLDEQNKLKGWFTNSILSTAKINIVDKVKNPPFIEELKRKFPINFDYENAHGVTFGNLILMASVHVTPASHHWISTLFHELVHVVQFDILKIEGFVRLYVEGVINGLFVNGGINNNFKYENIPLEINAYNLQGDYDRLATGTSYIPVEKVVKKFFNI